MQEREVGRIEAADEEIEAASPSVGALERGLTDNNRHHPADAAT